MRSTCIIDRSGHNCGYTCETETLELRRLVVVVVVEGWGGVWWGGVGGEGRGGGGVVVVVLVVRTRCMTTMFIHESQRVHRIGVRLLASPPRRASTSKRTEAV